ncbi:Uncharacterized protein TCM_014147 [Theobroma cacao]|uniref:Uncharacterized protein n=1 Tax=Theobroma cacao TaxID=3641 RepID=A0A061FYL2_THECC|nr:Uncharacterized protein TCM_014147 [Theobroma cacao]
MIKNMRTENEANMIKNSCDVEFVLALSLDHINDGWIFVSGATFRISTSNEFVTIYEECSNLLMGMTIHVKVVGISIVYFNIFDVVVRVLFEVRHTLKIRRNLISLGYCLGKEFEIPWKMLLWELLFGHGCALGEIETLKRCHLLQGYTKNDYGLAYDEGGTNERGFMAKSKGGRGAQRSTRGRTAESLKGVAAAAYAINSLEEDEVRRRIKTERLRNDTTTRVRNSDRVTRRYSSKEVRTVGETSSRKSKEQDYRRQESALTTRKPGHSSSARPMTMEAGDQRWKGNSSQLNVVETKADAWEKAQMEKVNRRYEDKKASILAWANEKKLRAKIKMERRKKELEQKIKRNQQFYQAKIARIDHVAGGARAQADEQRRNEELKVKEKARKTRASGQDPVTCFCF